MAGERRAVIFANGVVQDYSALRSFLHPGDFIVAADGGLAHLQALKIDPHLLVGDLDSLPKDYVLPDQTRVVRHPPKKDETDLELALGRVLAGGFSTIRIAGALGGRTDHALGNLFLLTLPELGGCDLRLDDGLEEVFLIRSLGEVHGSPDDLVSLLPLAEETHGVVTRGLEYPLRNETLYPYRTRGISNRMTGSVAHVSIEGGALLCIHIRKSHPEENQSGRQHSLEQDQEYG